MQDSKLGSLRRQIVSRLVECPLTNRLSYYISIYLFLFLSVVREWEWVPIFVVYKYYLLTITDIFLWYLIIRDARYTICIVINTETYHEWNIIRHYKSWHVLSSLYLLRFIGDTFMIMLSCMEIIAHYISLPRYWWYLHFFLLMYDTISVGIHWNGTNLTRWSSVTHICVVWLGQHQIR